jgi:hypothetical protein
VIRLSQLHMFRSTMNHILNIVVVTLDPRPQTLLNASRTGHILWLRQQEIDAFTAAQAANSIRMPVPIHAAIR